MSLEKKNEIEPTNKELDFENWLIFIYQLPLLAGITYTNIKVINYLWFWTYMDTNQYMYIPDIANWIIILWDFREYRLLK